MHLKSRIEPRVTRSFGWLLVFLVFESAPLVSINAVGALEDSRELIDGLAGQPARVARKQQQQVHERKCVPLLNTFLSKPQSTNASSMEEDNSNRATRSTFAPTLPDNFTFSIGDIDMPLAQASSPIHSAMRLLSSLDSSLGGDDDEDEMEGAPDGEPNQNRENSIRFVQNKLHIADLNLTMLNFHLYNESQPRFGLGVNIGNATLTGRFFYDGPSPSLMGNDLMSRLAGHYRMSIDNVLVTASSNITYLSMNPDSDKTSAPFAPAAKETEKSSNHLVTNNFQMNISNLGYISIDILDAQDSSKQTSNYVLRMLQRLLQKTIKRTYNQFESYIRATLETEGRRFLDCELSRFSPIGPTQQNEMRSILNDLARIVTSEIRNSRHDRVAMPNLEVQREVLGTTALIVFTNGSLSGLSNLKLLGETKVKLQREHLIVNASLGWTNLRPHYNWTLYLGKAARAIAKGTEQPVEQPTASARGFVAADIKEIEFDTLISRGLGQAHSRVTVDELVIRRLDGPKMDLGGLPGMSRLTRATVNFFMSRLKQRLVSSVQPSLKAGLERVLNGLAIPTR